MYNCQIGTLCALIKQLTVEEIHRSMIMRDREQLVDRGIDPRYLDSSANSRLVSEKDLTDMEGWLTVASSWAETLSDDNIRRRIDLFSKRLKTKMEHHEFLGEVRALRETIEESITGRLFHLYDQRKAELFKEWKTEWADVMTKFPASTRDIFYSIDCYCNENNIASVFHSMRIVEHGLNALAADLGIDFGVQNWQNIIEQIEAQIKISGKSMKSGTEKSEKLKFYSTAAKELTFFKDGWRNHVSHGRGVYTDKDARKVIDHVQHFMTELARQLKQVD